MRPERLWGSPSLLSNGYQGLFPWGVKRPGREADHLRLVPRSKNVWCYTSTPPIRLHGVVLSSKGAQRQFTSILYKNQHHYIIKT
jgi:hypothetical protein